MTRYFRTGALLLVGALLVAACGDDDAAETTTTTAAAATTTVAGADWPDKLVFAAVPSEQQERLEESYKTTLEILNDQLGGMEFEFFQAADYAGVIEAMIAGRVDIAQFGPFSYVIAVGNGAEIEPIGAMTDGPDIEPGYQSYGITRADNAEVNSIEDFAGRRTCFVDPGSTSGFLYPSAGLLAAGIDPETGVEAVFAGGHDASGISVANGDCEVGFAFDSMVEVTLIESGDIEAGELKVVWESAVIAGSPAAMQSSLPDDLKARLVEIFADNINTDWAVANGYCVSADDCSFSDEEIWGYKTVADSFFDGIREVCRITNAAKCEGVS